MTDIEFERIFVFLKRRYGIDMSRKKEIVSGRLENYVTSHGYKTYMDYILAVESDNTGKLEKTLVNILTTNHTFFMRESEHFDYMKQVVLPYLKQKESINRDLRVWCAASSTGEEPYTLAMVMLDFFGLEQSKWDTKVLATDISTNVLKQAMHGEYETDAIEALPEHWKRRFFHQIPGAERCKVTNELKNEVIFRKFNLMDEFPFKRRLHVVFLRNVMIYFDAETKERLLKKVYNCLEPGGYLFIGRTETIDRSVVPFQLIRPSIFRKPEGV